MEPRSTTTPASKHHSSGNVSAKQRRHRACATASVGQYVRVRLGGGGPRGGGTLLGRTPTRRGRPHLANGYIRFVGPVDQYGGSDAGEWIGIELDDAIGEHDGCPSRELGEARFRFADTRTGRRYFRCRHKHGTLVRRSAIDAVLPARRKWVSTPHARGGHGHAVAAARAAAAERGRATTSGANSIRCSQRASSTARGRATQLASGQSTSSKVESNVPPAPRSMRQVHLPSSPIRGCTHGSPAPLARAVGQPGLNPASTLAAAMAAASAAALERDRAAWSCATNRTGHGSGMEIAVGAGLASGDWTRSGVSPERKRRSRLQGVDEADAPVSASDCMSDDSSHDDKVRRTPDKLPESVTPPPVISDGASCGGTSDVEHVSTRVPESVTPAPVLRDAFAHSASADMVGHAPSKLPQSLTPTPALSDDACVDSDAEHDSDMLLVNPVVPLESSTSTSATKLVTDEALLHEQKPATKTQEAQQTAALVLTSAIRRAANQRKQLVAQAHKHAVRRKSYASFVKDAKLMRDSVYDQDTSKLLFEGFAKKHSRGRFRSSWQSRYFVAEGHYLKYYGNAQRKKLKGAIDLNALCNVTRGPPGSVIDDGDREIHLLFDCSNANEETVDGEDAQHALTCESESERLIMVLRTASVQQCILWCAALQTFTVHKTTESQPQTKVGEEEEVQSKTDEDSKDSRQLDAKEAQRKLSRSGVTLRFDSKHQIHQHRVAISDDANSHTGIDSDPQQRQSTIIHAKGRSRQRVASRAAKEKAKQRAMRWSQLTRDQPVLTLAHSEPYES